MFPLSTAKVLLFKPPSVCTFLLEFACILYAQKSHAKIEIKIKTEKNGDYVNDPRGHRVDIAT